MTKKVLIALLIVAPISLLLAMGSAETAKLHGLNLQSAIWALASYGGSLIAIVLLCDSLRSNVVPIVLVSIVYVVNLTVTSMKYGIRNAIIAPISGVVLIILWKDSPT